MTFKEQILTCNPCGPGGPESPLSPDGPYVEKYDDILHYKMPFKFNL
jgi:hypothetical protein